MSRHPNDLLGEAIGKYWWKAMLAVAGVMLVLALASPTIDRTGPDIAAPCAVVVHCEVKP